MRRPAHPSSMAAAQALWTLLVALVIALGFARSDGGRIPRPSSSAQPAPAAVAFDDDDARVERPAGAVVTRHRLLDDDDDDTDRIDRRPNCARRGRRARHASSAALAEPVALRARRALSDVAERDPAAIRLASQDAPRSHDARGPPRA